MDDRPLVVGKGSKWEVKPGVWQYRHSLGKDPVTGKYRYSPKRTIHTKKKSEVNAALEAYKLELNSGATAGKAKTPLSGYATSSLSFRKGDLAPTTYARQQYVLEDVKKLFGSYNIEDLKPSTVKAVYARAREDQAYSEHQLFKVHKFLTRVMNEAVEDEIILKNPCAGISVPRPSGKKERIVLDAAQYAFHYSALLKEEPSSVSVALVLLFDLGIRRGEALGLTWKNFNEERAEVFICQQFTNDMQLRPPKSKSSIRSISLTEQALSYLLDWRERQREELAELGLAWSENLPIVHELAVEDVEGEQTMRAAFHTPRLFDKEFRDWCVDRGLGEYTLTPCKDPRRKYNVSYHGLTAHSLRHTQATLLIGNGVDLKTVQTRLGHAQISITMDIYSHAIAENDRKAAGILEGMLSTG